MKLLVNILSQKIKVWIFVHFILILLTAAFYLLQIISLAYLASKILNLNINPTLFHDYFYANKYEYLLIVFIIFFSACFSFFRIYSGSFLTQRISSSLGNHLIHKFLNDKEKNVYLDKNKFSATILTNSNELTNYLFVPLFELISSITISSIITAYLIYSYTYVSIICFTVLIIIYLFFYHLLKKPNHDYAVNRDLSAIKRSKYIKDILTNIEEINIFNISEYFKKIFFKINNEFHKSYGHINFNSQYPRYIIEGCIFIILVIMAYFLQKDENLNHEIIYIITLYIISFQKMIPEIQKIYKMTSFLKMGRRIFYSFIDQINILGNTTSSFPDIQDSFSLYHSNKKYEINLSQNLNSIIIYGPSGSGKSTFIKTLFSEIYPNNILQGQKSSYQSVSLLSQSSKLFEQNILFNITFNMNIVDIDNVKLTEILKICFIEKLYQRIKSEDNIAKLNLSGGEIQRICIARALFKQSNLYIFDEPTSALDNKLKEKLTKNLLNYLNNKLVIFISHDKTIKKLFKQSIIID